LTKKSTLHLAKCIQSISSFDSQQRPLSREVRNRALESVIAESGGVWQFNQIVGWLRLFVEGRTIGCHIWRIDAKRIGRRMRNKRLQLATFSDVLGAWFPDGSSKEIFDELLKRLTDIAGEPPYLNRHVDLDVFRRIGPFIDWRSILAGQPTSEKV
jgi:hypothetical protein